MKKSITLVALAAIALSSCTKENNSVPAPVPGAKVEAFQQTTSFTGVLYYSPYDIENNVWNTGANPGPQTLWANSANNWGVWSNQPNTGGVKSYPNENYNVNKTYSSVSTVNSSFNVSVPTSSGVWDCAYDVWFNNYSYEIMVWEAWRNCSPIAVAYNSNGPVWCFTNVNIGGQTFNVVRGYTDHEVISFVPTGQVTSHNNLNIKALLDWANNQHSWNGVSEYYNFPSKTLTRIGFGFEVTSSSGGLNFQANSYSLSAY